MSVPIEIGSVVDTGEGMDLDVEALIGSHAAIVANSGAGKSGLLRRILEVTHGRVQHVVLDIEDEFYTLRESFDYVIAGGDGADVPARLGSAGKLAITALEQGFSTIVQLNDLGEDAPLYVGDFLDGLMRAPRELWRPLLVVVDEVQRFAPSVGRTDATAAIKSIVQRGRKRGFTGLFASLRISEVDPGLRGLVNNWMLGRVGQSLDRDTMSKQLGFKPSSAEAMGLQTLAKRRFWGFGPALTAVPTLFRVSDVTTTPVRPGQAKIPTPPPPEALREILSALAGPAPVESTPFDPDGGQVAIDAGELARLRAEVEDVRRQGAADLEAERYRHRINLRRAADDLAVTLGVIERMVEALGDEPTIGAEPPPAPEPAAPPQPNPKPEPKRQPAEPVADEPTGRAREVLQTLCAMPGATAGVLEKAWAMVAGIDRKSSTWRGHKAKLRGWFWQTGDRVQVTPEALALFPALPPMPRGSALVEQWARDLPSGSAQALRIIYEAGAAGVDRHSLATQLGTEASKSTFRGYMAPLSTLELIDKVGDAYRISPDFLGAL